MEKSLVNTDQISAKAAAVTARKPAIPARRAVSAKPLGGDAHRMPNGDQPQRQSARQQVVGGQSQCYKKCKTTKRCHDDSKMILARRRRAKCPKHVQVGSKASQTETILGPS